MMQNHYIISQSEDYHQMVYYLAEAGVNSAYQDLLSVINEVHEETLMSYKWDPISNPFQSVQEGARNHIESKFGAKLNDTLTRLNYLTTSLYPNKPVLPDIALGSTIDVEIRFLNYHTSNPIKLLIISKGKIGKIRRRIDVYLDVNKVSQVYDSKLFDMALITGGRIDVFNGGSIKSVGNVYSQGGVQAGNHSNLNIIGDMYTKQNIQVMDGSTVNITGDVICGGLLDSGLSPSQIVCSKDVYVYDSIQVSGLGNTIEISGRVYNSPNGFSPSVGISAVDGGQITIKDDIYINGTITYNALSKFLFGLEELPLPDGSFISGESIGGNNSNFYFPGTLPEYANNIFDANYSSISPMEKADILYDYLTIPPDSIEDLSAYNDHISQINKDSITLHKDEEWSGYAAGIIFTNGRVLKKRNLEQFTSMIPSKTVDTFFQDILLYMDSHAGWNFRYQLAESVQVLSSNAILEDINLTILDSNKPMVFIQPEEKDIMLLSGNYSGIIFTNGSLTIAAGENVTFDGLMIVGGKINVNGNLTVKQNRKLLLKLLEVHGEPLMNFFKISKEKPLVEIKSYKEQFFNFNFN